MYFVGVSTARSIIMRVFPVWADRLGFGDCELRGIDLALHDRPEHYRAAVQFIMGAGGSSIALCSSILKGGTGGDKPARMFVSNRSPGRLEEMRKIHALEGIDFPIQYVHTPHPADNDRVMGQLSPGSLVVNATGLGKDGPGSPITDAASFPTGGLAWDFNYRGELEFLRQARRQASDRSLHVEDGWLYFIYGWLSVIAEVFHRDIPLVGQGFDELCRVAEQQKEARAAV
jgi:shikimate 5-dehydrogenase